MSQRRDIISSVAAHVSIARLWDRLMALAHFGALSKGGVNRQALCDEEIPARAQLHYFCPTAMIFIPCKDGISHNEAESIRERDALDGARVMAEMVFALANAD
ncbi:MAG: hypothetical protein WBD95_15260 [Xanthobacteraceae bacterium]